MRSATIVALAAVSTLALGASAANATTFFLNFTGPLGSSGPGPIVLDATPDGGGVYTVNSATGDIGGSPVTLFGNSDFENNDNQITFPSTPALDGNGIAFSAGGADYDLLWIEGIYAEFCTCTEGAQALDKFSLTAAPEPATWALMLVGFAGLGAALRTRRRVVAA